MAGSKSSSPRPGSPHSPSAGEFWLGLAHRELLALRCRSCGEIFFPPRPVCPECLCGDLAPAQLSGRGTLHAWTVIRRAGTDFEAPFVLGLIDLEEGVGRIAAPIIDFDVANADRRLEIGMPLHVDFVVSGDQPALYCLKLA